MLKRPQEAATRIRKIAADLEGLANIPLEKQHLALVTKVQTDSCCEDITTEYLESVRRPTRALVKLIDPVERKIVYRALLDEIGAGVQILVDAVNPGMDEVRLTIKARRFLESHMDHIALQKLHRAEQLTPTDLAGLERMLLVEAVPVSDRQAAIARRGAGPLPALPYWPRPKRRQASVQRSG